MAANRHPEHQACPWPNHRSLGLAVTIYVPTPEGNPSFFKAAVVASFARQTVTPTTRANVTSVSVDCPIVTGNRPAQGVLQSNQPRKRPPSGSKNTGSQTSSCRIQPAQMVHHPDHLAVPRPPAYQESQAPRYDPASAKTDRGHITLIVLAHRLSTRVKQMRPRAQLLHSAHRFEAHKLRAVSSTSPSGAAWPCRYSPSSG